MVTVALATTAPEGSVTVPVTLAEFPVCAMLGGAATNARNSNTNVVKDAFTKLMNESPFMNGGLCAAQRQPRMNCNMKMECDACREKHGTR
jgi:hypothetical protein